MFTHFPPADTYNGELTGEELARFERNFMEEGRATLGMDLFGHGDGGGGPTREMMAAGRRARDLEGSPKVEFGTAADFFDRARAEHPDAPVWNGELYLELHRGTYSAQLGTKQGNRRSEHVLHEAERAHAEIAERAEQVIAAALAALEAGEGAQAAGGDSPADGDAGADGNAPADGHGTAPLLLNTAPVPRRGVPAYAAGQAENGQDAVVVIREGERTVLENAALRAELDADGSLVSLVDLATGSETIAPGARGALLQLHRDTPNAWDAWDIDEFYRRTVRDLATPLEVTAGEEDGGARVAFTCSTAAGEGEDSRGVTGAGSTIVKTFVLRPGDESLGIELDLDWKERKKALKLAFPLDLRAAHLSSEIQFGHVDRPIPVNTSWDFARFETCAHRWVHAAEGGFGVALANDSTYGHDVLRTVREFDGGTTTTIRQTLVRAPEFPDPSADEGRYHLRVALRPGAGIPDAIQEGYRLNLPEREVTAATAAGAGAPLVTVQDGVGAGAGAGAAPTPGTGSGQVLVETVKLAEDRSGDLVLRLYESLGARAEATLVLDPAPDGGAAPGAPAPVG